MHRCHDCCLMAQRREHITCQRATGMEDKLAAPILSLRQPSPDFRNRVVRNGDPDQARIQDRSSQHHHRRLYLSRESGNGRRAPTLCTHDQIINPPACAIQIEYQCTAQSPWTHDADSPVIATGSRHGGSIPEARSSPCPISLLACFIVNVYAHPKFEQEAFIPKLRAHAAYC